jgi:hypothetical protein
VIVKYKKEYLLKRKTNLEVHPMHRMSTSFVNKDKYKNVLKPSKMSESLVNSNANTHLAKNDFISPSKRKLIASSVSQPKRYVLDSNQLVNDNKYHVLSEHSYASAINDETLADGMDDSPTDDDQSNSSKLKIPPIFLHDVNNHQEIIKDVKDKAKASFSTQVRGQSLKINLSNIDDFRNLTAFYDSAGIKYHTFQALHDKRLEVIIRNVPTSLSENEIKTELIDLNYPVTRVTRLLNKNKLPLPLCAVDLQNNDDGKSIFKLKTLCYAIVSVEIKRRPRQIPQCTRCQRYGHTKNFCKLDPRCVRCTGQHHYSECPKPKNDSPQCINCGENHTANYRGCQFYQQVINKKEQNKHVSYRSRSSNVPNETNNQSPPNLSSADDFPTICGHDSVQVHPKLKVPFSKVVASSVHHAASNSNKQTEDDPNNISLSQSLEQIIVDIVKSFIPVLKKVISNVISSVLSHGSV